MTSPVPPGPDSVIWHDLECGAYEADLALWTALAAASPGAVVDLGSGTGRVALALARAGASVTAVDREPELVSALASRAAQEGLALEAIAADIRKPGPPGRYGLAIAAMQLFQVIGGAAERAAALAAVRRGLVPGGRLAAALLEDGGRLAVGGGPGSAPPLPDAAEISGWVYSSLPLETRLASGTLEVYRLRQVVSPAGELAERRVTTRLEIVSADELEREAAAAGLAPRARHRIPATAEHVGSVVVELEAVA